MNFSRKSKIFMIFIIGMVFQPFVFLYVNKPKFFFIYFAALFAASFSEHAALIKFFGGVPDWGMLTPWFFAFLCPIHALLIYKRRSPDEIQGWYSRWWVVIFSPVLFIVSVIFIRTFYVDVFYIPASSMSPTINPGDTIVVSKYGFYGNVRNGVDSDKNVNRGDIIVFISPHDSTTIFVKRVVGVPGDTVRYKEKALWIRYACMETFGCPDFKEIEKVKIGKHSDFDNNHLYEEFLDFTAHSILINPDRKPNIGIYRDEGEWWMAGRSYFVLGDNRDNSMDSRHWGLVPEENIIGKVRYIF